MRQKVELKDVKQYFPSRHNGASCGVAEHATVMITSMSVASNKKHRLPGLPTYSDYCIRKVCLDGCVLRMIMSAYART